MFDESRKWRFGQIRFVESVLSYSGQAENVGGQSQKEGMEPYLSGGFVGHEMWRREFGAYREGVVVEDKSF